jgi:hypothetical protein
MQVGDIGIETIKNIKTGTITTVEHVVTQEKVDAYNAQITQARILEINSEFKELCKLLPCALEEVYTVRGYTMTNELQAVSDAKTVLKVELATLTGSEMACNIDNTKLTKDDTTELQLVDVLFDLKTRIETLEGGV